MWSDQSNRSQLTVNLRRLCDMRPCWARLRHCHARIVVITSWRMQRTALLVPKYQVVYDALRKDIESGRLPAGGRVPSEADLGSASARRESRSDGRCATCSCRAWWSDASAPGPTSVDRPRGRHRLHLRRPGAGPAGHRNLRTAGPGAAVGAGRPCARVPVGWGRVAGDGPRRGRLGPCPAVHRQARRRRVLRAARRAAGGRHHQPADRVGPRRGAHPRRPARPLGASVSEARPLRPGRHRQPAGRLRHHRTPARRRGAAGGLPRYDQRGLDHRRPAGRVSRSDRRPAGRRCAHAPASARRRPTAPPWLPTWTRTRPTPSSARTTAARRS